MAAVTSAVIAGGAAVYGASQAGKAAKAGAKGADAAAAEQARQFDIATSLTANQRNIGNSALNALGARYGFNPAAGFGADYDPYDLSPERTSKGIGKKVFGQAEVRNLLDQGLSIDQILEMGTLDQGSDLKKLGKFKFSQTDIERLKNGTFSDGYLASQPQRATGTGIPSQFNPTPFKGPVNQLAPGQQSNALIDPNAPTSNLDRLRELAMTDPDLKRLSGPVDYSLQAFEASPDYQFRLNEGLKSVQNSAAARGGLFSGNALRGITDYASGLASGEYNDFVGRQENKRGQEFTRRLGLLESDFKRQADVDQLGRSFADGDFNRLASLAGIGTTATAQLNNIGSNTAANIGNALTAAGNARASGIEGRANAFAQGANNIGQIAGYFYGGGRGSGVGGGNSGVPYYLQRPQ